MTPDRPPRRLNPLGAALDGPLHRLQREYLHDEPWARAQIAKLRRAVGARAGSVPEIWECTIAVVPDELRWDRDEPSRAEQAVHTCLTLYAMHQQSVRTPMHTPGIHFASAMQRLAWNDNRSEAAVTRRFMTATTATSVRGIVTHARGLVSQLQAEQIGFDYARFADDLLKLLTPEQAPAVRLAWGREFYRNNTSRKTGDAGNTMQNTQEQS